MTAAGTLTLFRPSILDPAPVAPWALRDDAAVRPALLDRGPVGAPASAEDDISRAPARAGQQHPELPSTGGGLTLDDLVVEVWEGLSAHRTVPCPACGGAMAPRYGAGPGPVGGRCGDCRTTIA